MTSRLLVVALLGCASGGEDDATTLADSATVVDAATDSVSDALVVDSALDDVEPHDGPIDAIFPVEDTAPPKVCGRPMGTTATASDAYMSTASQAIDGNLGSYWNSGSPSGWLRLKFPKAIVFDRVRIAAMGVPACNHAYTISGFNAGTGAKIGAATRAVPESKVAWTAPIEVTAGAYDELLIAVAPAASWIAIGEVTVFDSTGGCAIP